MKFLLSLCFASYSYADISAIKNFSHEILELAKTYSPSDRAQGQNNVFKIVNRYFEPELLVKKITKNTSLQKDFSNVLKRKIAVLCTDYLSKIKGCKINIVEQDLQGSKRFLCSVKKGQEKIMGIVVLGDNSNGKINVSDVIFEGVSAYHSVRTDVNTGCNGAPNKRQCIDKNIVKLIQRNQSQ